MSRKMQDTDFMAELEAAAHIRPAAPVMMMFFSIMALMLFFLIWAGVAQIDELTRGQGQVVPSQEVQVVQSLEGGILGELLVKEGQQVKKGEVLLRISDVQFSSEEKGTEAKVAGLAAKKARLEAEAKGTDFVVPKDIADKNAQIAANEKALYVSRQQELKNSYGILEDRIQKASAELSEVKAQVGRMADSRKHLQKELDLTREMVRQRAVPKLEEMRLDRELSDINGQISAESQKQKGLESELAAARKEKENQADKFRSQALGEMNAVETEMSSLQENLKTMGDRVYRAELRSPVEGIVNSIAVKTIGGVIEPAMKLVEIVPVDDELKIIAKVPPDEIAFLRPGQGVKVKITAYDSQRYGTLDGTLVRIGANSVTDHEGNVSFEIEVRTAKNYLGASDNPLPITPGMVAQTEVVTGKRTILQYLLKPVLRARDSAFTER
ncbi:MAG: HlyD family type I secretion periplasmic adaptor subunit [Alphaproteobacteria bacterium]